MALLYQKEDKIVTITLNRPEAMNTFDPETTTELSEAMIKFRDDPGAWVAIITGTGEKAFSAGADLKKLIPDAQAKGSTKNEPTIARGLNIYKPFIAAINGLALGGGLELALACDIRIAAEHATFGVPEVKWNLIPGWGGTQRLPRMITRAKASEMLLMGITIDAKEAYRIGLVNIIVPLAELMSTAKAWALKICDNGPLSVRAAKEAMLSGLDTSLAEGLALEQVLIDQLIVTEDSKEGPRAFIEKRKPVYKGK